ncbi:sensor histidine kinase [Butyrivibrio sp. INlla16]|uniref:sensor histidine kinase n=1 Tax=Butyrivibrio sp. INlla16 TaxID=1520807 RepID=UPI0008810370|nr:sensor histidine kinase [Butyrivibrio sp. INlla16]SDB10889.1 two-component system, sensor histidine kinase YesM [Butyrivibrio sp. INlla16]
MENGLSRRSVSGKSKLANQIRISYVILLLPSIIFMAYAFYNMWTINERYKDMLSSVVAASEFSLDFKEDFDYETYLLIVGNVTLADSKIPEYLSDAREVVERLEDYTDTKDNRKRLESAQKYLNNLETYIDRIEDNMNYEDRYEANITIWENDVQIVTSLLQETINEYVYYENRQLQTAQQETSQFYFDIVKISTGLFAFIVIFIMVMSFWGPLWITRPIEEQVKNEQKQLRKAEFELLQAQINPHFLYNTLDAIVWSAEAGNQKQVVSMVGSLSDFFRSSLNKGKEIVTIREDLQHVRSYLEIQQIRYQDILSYEIDVPETIYDYVIPKITIQPVVENALYHGIKNRRGGGKIIVTGGDLGEFIQITVKDDGMGISDERLVSIRENLKSDKPEDNTIYGLYNINERIRLSFGDEYGVGIDSTEGVGTIVNIRLPKILTEIIKK